MEPLSNCDFVCIFTCKCLLLCDMWFIEHAWVYYCDGRKIGLVLRICKFCGYDNAYNRVSNGFYWNLNDLGFVSNVDYNGV